MAKHSGSFPPSTFVMNYWAVWFWKHIILHSQHVSRTKKRLSSNRHISFFLFSFFHGEQRLFRLKWRDESKASVPTLLEGGWSMALWRDEGLYCFNMEHFTVCVSVLKSLKLSQSVSSPHRLICIENVKMFLEQKGIKKRSLIFTKKRLKRWNVSEESGKAEPAE